MRMPRPRVVTALPPLVGVLMLAAPAVAQAHPTNGWLSAQTTIRVHGELVLGHHVRVCSWKPGDNRVRGLVRYSKHLKTVPGWAQAGLRPSRAVCALNGGTYRTAPGVNQYRPSGTVYAQGRRIRGLTDAPAVGFVGGHVFFGARLARKHGAKSIMNALAYLVRDGKAQLNHRLMPWTTLKQFSCGAPGTDGTYGCSRSVVAQMRNGRVAMIEIGHASMPLAAKILVRMGVKTAVTFDSGGAALMWTLQGSHNTGSRTQVGHLIGATVGSAWKRRIPDAVIVNARPL